MYVQKYKKFEMLWNQNNIPLYSTIKNITINMHLP